MPGEVEGLDLDTRRPVVRSETVAQKASAQSASESWAGSAKRAPCESGHGPASRQLGGLRRRRRVGRRGIRARVLKSHELGHAQPDAMGPTWRPAVFGSRSPPVSPPAPSMRGTRARADPGISQVSANDRQGRGARGAGCPASASPFADSRHVSGLSPLQPRTRDFPFRRGRAESRRDDCLSRNRAVTSAEPTPQRACPHFTGNDAQAFTRRRKRRREPPPRLHTDR